MMPAKENESIKDKWWWQEVCIALAVAITITLLSLGVLAWVFFGSAT